MRRAYKIFVADILKSMEKIERYVSGMSFEDFSGNELVVDAVLRNLEIIGEASKNIPEQV